MRTERRLYEPQKFNARSRQRFAADRKRELQAHLGRPASYTELVLIARIVANEYDLRRLDARLDAGLGLSGHAARLRLALENRLRLDLRELGFAPKAPAAPSLTDVLRDIEASRGKAVMAWGGRSRMVPRPVVWRVAEHPLGPIRDDYPNQGDTLEFYGRVFCLVWR